MNTYIVIADYFVTTEKIFTRKIEQVRITKFITCEDFSDAARLINAWKPCGGQLQSLSISLMGVK